MPETLASRPRDRTIKTLTGDPDSCSVGFNPLGYFEAKFREGAIVFITTGGLGDVAVHPHRGKAFRTILSLPGTAGQWVVEVDTLTNTIRARRPDIQLAFAMRAHIGRDHEMRVRFGQRPPSNNLRIGTVLDAGVTMRVNAAGQLEFVESGEPYLTLGTWSGRSALGNPAGATWRVDASQRLWIDLTTAEWDALVAADYPVVMD